MDSKQRQQQRQRLRRAAAAATATSAAPPPPPLPTVTEHNSGEEFDHHGSNNNDHHHHLSPSSIHLTPTADGILDVTPVNSPTGSSDGGSRPSRSFGRLHQTMSNDDAFSSSSSDDDKNDDDNDALRIINPSDTASAASSSLANNSSNQGAAAASSEWDKALRTGVPNRGHVSEFFAAKLSCESSDTHSSAGSGGESSSSKPASTNNGTIENAANDFLSNAESEVLKEATGASSSGEGSGSSSSSKKAASVLESAAAPPPPSSRSATATIPAAALSTAAMTFTTASSDRKLAQSARSAGTATTSPPVVPDHALSTRNHAGKNNFNVNVSRISSNKNKSSSTSNASTGGSASAAAGAAAGGNSLSSNSSVSSSNVSAQQPHKQPSASAVALMTPPPPSSMTMLSKPHPAEHSDHLSSGVLPDVLMTMRQKIESLTLFDSDMMRLAAMESGGFSGGSSSHGGSAHGGGGGGGADSYYSDDPVLQESRESLKRSSQQSISAAVLVSLAHKRYERRRLAAMEIEKVVRSLVQQQEIDRVRAILLLLSDDYVRSTSEDARKGGVVALAACAIGLKKAKDNSSNTSGSSSNVAETDEQKHNAFLVQECRDLILASVVHACQDHSQRVRYYATESLFNVVKVIPVLAIQHFFILFEILRSLYADVDVDVRSGAELLDKKLKEVIVHAMNSGTFAAEDCVPVFARFVYIRNKATKQLTLTWLQELSEKLVGAPILEFVHLFLGGIFDMIADPNVAIRQSALAFLQSVLPKLLVLNSDTPIDENGMTVDFDKILQSLVTTMEHPDPFVRKVAVYWMSRIVKAHIGEATISSETTRKKLTDGTDANVSDDDKREGNDDGEGATTTTSDAISPMASAASISVRNSVPHVLPGILLSIGDTYNTNSTSKDSFLPDQRTQDIAEQTNACLQASVRRDGPAYVQHLDGFIVALREELDSPGGFIARNTPAMERSPYRMDVKQDGTGIESPGWFRTSSDTKERADTAMVLSRQCALTWVSVLYEFVVPTPLKADYAREFVIPIIHQLVDNPPKGIVYKSLEVLAKITVPVLGEEVVSSGPTTALGQSLSSSSLTLTSKLGSTEFGSPAWAASAAAAVGASINDAPQIPMNEASIEYALDILGPERRRLISRDRKVFSALIQLHSYNEALLAELTSVLTYMCKLQPPEFVMISFSVELDRFIRKQNLVSESSKQKSFAKDLRFVSSFIQHMCHVLLTAEEAKEVRDVLIDCVGSKPKASTERDRQRTKVFHILLHSFAHNLPSALSLCLWSGAFRSASLFLSRIDPMDINLIFLLEIDRLVEMLERPIFRRLHIRMLERDTDIKAEGSGTMLFRTLKSLLMIIPKSTCYNVLRDRLNSVAKFRQSTITVQRLKSPKNLSGERDIYVVRVLQVRALHCQAEWQTIRAESLETIAPESSDESGRVSPSKKAKIATNDGSNEHDGRGDMTKNQSSGERDGQSIDEQRWKMYWANAD